MFEMFFKDHTFLLIFVTFNQCSFFFFSFIVNFIFSIMAGLQCSVVAKGEGKGVGWIGNLGLIHANYCLWNG